MLYMVLERFSDTAAVYRRFQEKGRMLPEGLSYVRSWVDAGETRCFQIMETSNPELLTRWTECWNDLVEFEVVPVALSRTANADAIDNDQTNSACIPRNPNQGSEPVRSPNSEGSSLATITECSKTAVASIGKLDRHAEAVTEPEQIDFNTDEFVTYYDDMPLWSAPFGQLLLESVPLRSDITALDIGCGTGFPLLQLAARLGPHAHITGIDPWEAAIRRVQSKIAHKDFRNVSAVLGDGAHTGFPDHTFDLVVSNLGVNNFDDPPAVLSECHRIMKPQGVLAITTNPYGHMREFYNAYRTFLSESGRKDLAACLDREEAHRLSVEAITELFRRNGFRLTKTVERAFTMRYADGTALFSDPFIKLAFTDGWRSILPVEDRTSMFNALEKRLNLLASQQCGLSLTIPMAYVEFQKD